jgi:hypothetical protein
MWAGGVIVLLETGPVEAVDYFSDSLALVCPPTRVSANLRVRPRPRGHARRRGGA